MYKKLFGHKYKVGLALVLLSFFLPVFLLSVKKNTDDRQRASEADFKTVPTSTNGYISNEILVKVKQADVGNFKESDGNNNTSLGAQGLDTINKKYKVKSFKKIGRGKAAQTGLDTWYKLELDGPREVVHEPKRNDPNVFSEKAPKSNIHVVINELKKDPTIETAEPNFVYSITQSTTPQPTGQQTPNDPFYATSGSWGQAYPDLWGLKAIQIDSAWQQTKGSSSVIIADIDTGVDYTHEDLAANIWKNPKEIQGNNIDDDQNGYVDDYNGWDFVNDDNDPMDDFGHGSHTVGTIAGVGNNGKGVVGVNWTSSVMALKFLSSSGEGTSEGAALAIDYATNMGARVLSNSWGGGDKSQILDDAIAYAYNKNVVIVAAAGNETSDAYNSEPGSNKQIITVGASDSQNKLAIFSNFGQKIDVVAPGVDILSVKAKNNLMCDVAKTVNTLYCHVSGTSMATPHVAGLIGLMLAKNPTLSNEEIRQILRTSATDLGTSGQDKSFGFGLINAGNSVTSSTTKPLTPYISNLANHDLLPAGPLSITGSIGGPNFASYILDTGSGLDPQSWTVLSTGTILPQNGVFGTINPANFSDGTQIIRLRAFDTSGKSYSFLVMVQVDNITATINYPYFGSVGGIVNIKGTAQANSGSKLANYTLEWSKKTDLQTWSTAGITLTSGGLSPIANGVLAKWDTGALQKDTSYVLRLHATSQTGAKEEAITFVTIDKDLLSGWPKLFPMGYWNYGGVALDDIDGDKVKEIIYAASDGYVHAMHKDGTYLPGFPVRLFPDDIYGYWINIDDLDGDGKKEIVLLTDKTLSLRVIRSDGTAYPNFPNIVLPSSYFSENASPAIADLNGDKKKELITFTGSGTRYYLHAYQLNGTELSGFPVSAVIGESIGGYSPVSVYDMDRDGKYEIAVGNKSSLYLFDNTGKLLPGWPKKAGSVDGRQIMFNQTPVFADLNGDGKYEVIADTLFDNDITPHIMVYGYSKSGSLLPGFPYDAGYNNVNANPRIFSPSIGDVTGDGKDDIVMTMGTLSIFSGTSLQPIYDPSNLIQSQSALVDIDGDSKLEVAGTSFPDIDWKQLYILRNNGSLYQKKVFETANYSVIMPPLFSDLDNNGAMDMVTLKQSMNLNTGIGYAMLYAYEFPKGSGPAKYEWPRINKDSFHSGRLLPPLPTITQIITPTPQPSQFSQSYTSTTGLTSGTTTGMKNTLIQVKTPIQLTQVSVFNAGSGQSYELRKSSSLGETSGTIVTSGTLGTTKSSSGYYYKTLSNIPLATGYYVFRFNNSNSQTFYQGNTSTTTTDINFLKRSGGTNPATTTGAIYIRLGYVK